MKVLIDNGHGVDTKGKRSPDGTFLEWKFARKTAIQIEEALKQKEIDCELIVPEDNDISLKERCRRVNDICEKIGTQNCFLISIHANAAGDGSKWMKGTGWEAYTTPGQTESDTIAEFLYKEAEKIFEGQKIRKDVTDFDSDKEADFYILKHTKCPAVLTENFFYDNKKDLEYLKSAQGQQQIVKVHIEGILNYLNSKK